jgi:hypothetical protein
VISKESKCNVARFYLPLLGSLDYP